MNQNPKFELKQKSKSLIRDINTKAYAVSSIFVALTFIMGILVTNLSGMGQYMTNYMEEYTDAYVEALELAEETQDFEAAADILVGAMDEAAVWPEVAPFAIILSAVMVVMTQIVGAGYTNYCLMAVRGEKVGIRDLFDGFYYTGRLILLILIRAIIVAVGFVLFVVPGIVLIYSYRMAIYIAFEHPDWGPIACLKESRFMMKGKKREVFKVEISFFWWFLASQTIASFTIPIVDIWVKPYVGFTMAQMYNKISGYVPKANCENTESEGKGNEE